MVATRLIMMTNPVLVVSFFIDGKQRLLFVLNSN